MKKIALSRLNELFAAIAAGQIDVGAIATNIFAFEDGAAAMYQAFHNKQEITKAVIKF